MSVNRVILVGHLGADPESRFLPSGTAVVNFTVATSEKWNDKESGEKKEKTEWSRCSAFGATAEACAKYLKKGSQVYIEGKLDTRKYQKDGVDHYATQIRVDRVQFLSPKGEAKPAAGGDYAAASGSSRKPAARDGGVGQMDDDIPFAPIGRGISGHAI